MPEKIGTPSPDLQHTPAPEPVIDFDAIAGDMPMDDQPMPKTAAPAAPQSEEPAEGDEPPPSGAKPTWMDKRFGDLAKKSQELRTEREALKPVVELSKALSPTQAAALQKALAAGNPMSAMNALGFSYADIAASVAGGGANPPPKAPAKPAAEEEPEVSPSGPAGDPEWEEFKKERREAKTQAQRNSIITGIKTHLEPAAATFKHVTALESYGAVMDVLDEIYKSTGSLPSDSAAENIKIAAEELERRYVEGEIPLTRKQWEKVQGLTQPVAPASTTPEATRVRPGNAPVSRGSSRTLTNNAGAPPSAPAANPTDPNKLISDLVSDPNMPWS